VEIAIMLAVDLAAIARAWSGAGGTTAQ